MAMTDGFRFEPSPRWVRAVLNGTTVADSKRMMLLWEPKRLPVYCFPREDVRMDLLQPAGELPDPLKGATTRWTARVGDRVADDAAWTAERSPEGCPDLSGYVVLSWRAMDTWYEEDDVVYVHPRDPYHRVDVMNSSRHVRVEMLGETIAETRRPRLLFETGLPTRYYIPRRDVRMDLLVPSDTVTECPYKGRATYYGVRVGNRLARDLVWTYEFPILECGKIENLLCFYNERVDALHVDGHLEAKPESPWSRPAVIVDVERAG
jgi:uncharacterized protein (DUF427 family)